MSDLEDSTVTYTEVSSPFEDLSDIGSLGVDGLPMMSQDPYAYVEAALQAPPSPDYVLGPEHIPSRYIPKSNLEEDPEEDDEDLEEDPTPNDRDDEDEKEESSRDEADDEEEDEDEDEEEEEEEHPALADSIHHLYTVSFVAMLRATAPSTYILAPRSETPSSGTSPLLPIPLPTSSLPLRLPSNKCGADVREVTLPPQKRLCIALGPRFKVGESSFAPTARPNGGFRADYGFVGTLDDEIRRDPESEVVVRDCRIAGSRLHMTVIVSRGTDSAKDTADTNGIIAETACHTSPR
uniref:Uncharacterized protein n=1 Tax=Tanacetum cinerariifolium TaxID=118510 RepID=A0A699K5X0_TANCI|nr:hypothetical protein [Tanacetum cinerariifolium]